jgi:DNA-binding CsgD family transcriptional regulator
MKLEPEQAAAAIAKANARADAARRRAALADRRSELARARADQAQRRAEQAEARTELAKTRAEQAEIRTEHAKTRAEHAETRADHAETRAEQAAARAELAEAIVEKLVEKLLSMPAVPAPAEAADSDPTPFRAAEAETDRRALENLTARQRDVLQFLASGHNTKETAAKLDLSPKTVEYHRLRLMRTLNVHDLAGLVRFAVRVGLVPPGP